MVSGRRIMERWQWEVCKMFLYMAFPVGCFHYFNCPQIFEDSIVKLKESHPARLVIEDKSESVVHFINELKKEKELKRLDEIESSYKNTFAN